MTATTEAGAGVGGSLECTYEQFKAGVAEFVKAAPECDSESLENGKKALALMYFGMTTDHEYERLMAEAAFEYGLRKYNDRHLQLLFATGAKTP